jgi:hypothetical protein
MEAASSGLVIDRAIEPGVQIFGWEVANAAALELGRGARQRAQMLTAPPKSHARRRPCRNRWRIGFLDVASPLPQTRPRDWSLKAHVEHPAPVRRNKRAVHLPPSDSKRCRQSVSHADLGRNANRPIYGRL